MKRTAFALTRQTHIGGSIVEAGTIVAIVESEYPFDSIFSLAGQMGLTEVQDHAIEASQAEEDQVEATDEESLVEPEQLESSPVVEQVEVPAEGILLNEAGMSEALYSRLATNGITTVEQLTEFIAGGGDLVELEDIGTTYAKRILGWFNSRNNS